MRLSISTLLLLLMASTASAFQGGGVHGSVRYDYVDYQAEDDALGEETASSFSQQYTLLYSAGGLLSGGRAGRYTLAVGAEYSAYDNSINENDSSVTTFKPLYSGDVVVAPGGLPFRLHLFCNDRQKTAFSYDGGIDNELLRPAVTTDVRNGTHRTTGATLLLGIKNGSYLGSYRDKLSKFPRLLVDYRETEAEDREGNDDIHYVLRDLAFVSLNKKDNWFHYRVRQYRDYLEPSGVNDYVTRSYILGTIDPLLNRAWINLTNWIKISADGSFTQENTGAAGTQEEQVDTYALNLFARARRATGNAATYGGYSRTRDARELDQRLSIPIYFNRRVNRDVGYSGEVSYRARSEEDNAGLVLNELEDTYAKIRVEARQTQPYILAPELAAELTDTEDGQGSALRAGAELYNNTRYRLPTDLKLRYVLARFQGEYRGSSNDYLEQELSVRVGRRAGTTWRYGGNERLMFGSGDLQNLPTTRIRPAMTLSQINSTSRNVDRSGTIFRSVSNFYVSEHTKSYDNRLDLDIDYLQDDTVDSLQTELTHTFEYGRQRVLSYTMNNTLSVGDDQTRVQGDVGGGSELSTGSGGNSDLVFRHESSLRYLPNRVLDARVYGGLLSNRGDIDSDHIFAGEEARYNIYRYNGVMRLLMQFTQKFNYELVDREGAQANYYKLSVSTRYYPTGFLNLFAFGQYETRPEEEQDLITGRAGVQFSFPKFDVNVNYAYVERVADGTIGNSNRKEQQLRASVQKIF